jgi:hypothetical protein
MPPSEVQLDRRRNAVRDDIADAALEGRITPRRFVEGAPWFVSAAHTPVYPRPDAGGDRDTEALSGEAVTVFEVRDGWAWVQLARDRYVGFVRTDACRHLTERAGLCRADGPCAGRCDFLSLDPVAGAAGD